MVCFTRLSVPSISKLAKVKNFIDCIQFCASNLSRLFPSTARLVLLGSTVLLEYCVTEIAGYVAVQDT